MLDEAAEIKFERPHESFCDESHDVVGCSTESLPIDRRVVKPMDGVDEYDSFGTRPLFGQVHEPRVVVAADALPEAFGKCGEAFGPQHRDCAGDARAERLHDQYGTHFGGHVDGKLWPRPTFAKQCRDTRKVEPTWPLVANEWRLKVVGHERPAQFAS